MRNPVQDERKQLNFFIMYETNSLQVKYFCGTLQIMRMENRIILCKFA